MCVNLSLGNLNLGSYSLYPINTYTCKVTTAIKMHSDNNMEDYVVLKLETIRFMNFLKLRILLCFFFMSLICSIINITIFSAKTITLTFFDVK